LKPSLPVAAFQWSLCSDAHARRSGSSKRRTQIGDRHTHLAGHRTTVIKSTAFAHS
jgi:hypothetical protein